MSNSRISNGLNLTKASLSVLNKNKQLLIFPVLSTISLLVLIGTFAGLAFAGEQSRLVDSVADGSLASYAVLFVFYLFNYTIIVFFNMALIHCCRLYFHGKTPTVADGLRFSADRLGDIFAWAAFSATVGLVLHILEENLGRIGKIIVGLLGIAWSVTSFFVVPVIAYEKLGPLAAIKRSAQIMKEKWGESLTANFSIGLLQVLAIIACAIPVAILASYDYTAAAIVTAVVLFGFVLIVFSAAKVVFTSAVYERLSDGSVPDFDNLALDSLFITK